MYKSDMAIWSWNSQISDQNWMEKTLFEGQSICHIKAPVYILELCHEIGYSLQERLWGCYLDKTLEIFWMNNKTIIQFGFCMMWRIMQISGAVIHLSLHLDNSLLNLYNSSLDTKTEFNNR